MPHGRRLGSKNSHTNKRRIEDRVTSTLGVHDDVLRRLEEKLERPVLNGGFDDLVKKIEKIEFVFEQSRKDQVEANRKIDAIHVAVYDPDKGLYGKVKENTKFIESLKNALKWLMTLVIAGILTGIGKMIYDVVVGMIHVNR